VAGNLDLWEQVRAVPANAQKQIGGGRLKGMTDISPMWRIMKLTEQFGVCGVGWKYEITDKRFERGSDDQVAAFVDINLYTKRGEVWSDPIPGTGGSMFVELETRGLHTSDECFKMALTDAISVACKALGFGADVYWQGGGTKYTNSNEDFGEIVGRGKPSHTEAGAVASVEHAFGGKAEPENEEELSDGELQDRLNAMAEEIQKLRPREFAKPGNVIQHCSAFTGKDGKSVSRNRADWLTGKWLRTTYGKMKKLRDEVSTGQSAPAPAPAKTYDDSDLPF